MLSSIVEDLGVACKPTFAEQDAWKRKAARSRKIEHAIHRHVERILQFLRKRDPARTFDTVERGLVPLVFALGRLFLAFFLAVREERSSSARQEWEQRGYRFRRLQPHR